MFYFLIALVAGLFLFLQIPVGGYPGTRALDFRAYHAMGDGPPPTDAGDARSLFNGIEIRRGIPSARGDKPGFERMRFRLSNGGGRTGAAGEIFSVPFLGDGYFRYFKVGKEVTFHDRRGELLWKKKYHSYPVTDHRGKLILLLTGDGNRVDIMDENGNLVGAKTVSGNFLTDFDFASRAVGAALSFAGGEAYVINASGAIAYKYRRESKGKPLFFKSIALGPDGSTAAVHILTHKGDRIVVLGKPEEGSKARVLHEIALKGVYPHLLHMAVGPKGVLLLAAPDFTAFYDDDGDLVWKNVVGKPASTLYRPAYADQGFFVYGQGRRAVLVDDEGRAMAVLNTDGTPWQVFPGKSKGEFALRDGKGIRFYRFGSGVKTAR